MRKYDTAAVRCRICNRVLVDPFYANLRIGRICAGKHGIDIPTPVKKSVGNKIKAAKSGKKKLVRIIKIYRANKRRKNPLQILIPFKEYQLDYAQRR